MNQILTGAVFLLLFWILADVAPFYHTERPEAAHTFYSAFGVAAFVCGLIGAAIDQYRERTTRHITWGRRRDDVKLTIERDGGRSE